MDVFFTTVVRSAPVSTGGELIKLDWELKKIVHKVPIVPIDPEISEDPNPRGNTRGGRGVLIRGDQLLVATYHSLHVYDLGLNFKYKISHPLFVGLHEICQDAKGVYVSSTAIDCAIKVYLAEKINKSWWPRESEFLQRYLGFSPLRIDKSIDNRLRYLNKDHLRDESHLHLNAVCCYNGKLYALFGRLGIVYNLTDDKILVENKKMKGFHNLIMTDQNIIMLHTAKRRLMLYKPDGTFIKSINLLNFKEIRKIYHKANGNISDLIKFIEKKTCGERILNFLSRRSFALNQIIHRNRVANPIFARGLFLVDNSRALIGLSPATIIEIDFVRERLLDYYQYSENVAIAPHGLCAAL
jgi:hypothetical protein